MAGEVRATSAQVALAWLLAQGEGIAPIPGTTRADRIEENAAADEVRLTADQIARLNGLSPASGDRHIESDMATVDR